ncbi:MAG: MBOAT family protein [Nannocystaceae bacterium]|nr:MBOAT family protein [bacterium]
MGWIMPAVLAAGLALLVRSRRIPGALGVGCASVIPFVAPSSPQWLRLIVSAFAVVWAARVWERAHGREPDVAAGWRFWLWWGVPADARLPRTSAEAAENKRRGVARLLRAAAKLGVVVVVVGVNRSVDDITASTVGFTAWSMIYVYASISGVADALTGALMLTGLHMSESFEAPMLARSPGEFWGRRWNRFITRWAFRNVFIPAGGRRSPARATMLVFVLSGLMHEYLLVAFQGGWSRYAGWTLAFFIVHGLVVVATARVKTSLPVPAAIALHLAFLFGTAPLFLIPLDDAVGYSKWWLP